MVVVKRLRGEGNGESLFDRYKRVWRSVSPSMNILDTTKLYIKKCFR